MKNFAAKKNGFTLIELIVVISIVLIFSGISLAKYNSFTLQQKLKNEGKRLVDTIELTKKKSLASDLYDKNCQNFTGYRLTISSNNYLLSFCCGAVCSNVSSYSLTSDINVISGTGDLNFPPLMIGTNLTVNSIRIKHSLLNQCVDISVSPNGIADLNESLIGC